MAGPLQLVLDIFVDSHACNRLEERIDEALIIDVFSSFSSFSCAVSFMSHHSFMRR